MFFKEYSRFLETSETTKDVNKLEARHKGLILDNSQIIVGKRILDLASHDGRWSFAALHSGASHVYGIEWKPRLIKKTIDNFEHYNVPKERYTFTNGDIFEKLMDFPELVDVVFCFGVFYHIQHHMLLLERISKLNPASHVIIDSNVTKISQPVVEFLVEPKGTRLVGHPSRAGIHRMLQSYGWATKDFDWLKSGHLDGIEYRLYQVEKRVTVIGSR